MKTHMKTVGMMYLIRLEADNEKRSYIWRNLVSRWNCWRRATLYGGVTMNCELCGGLSNIIDVKIQESGVIFRERECKKCGNTWITMEVKVYGGSGSDSKKGQNICVDES